MLFGDIERPFCIRSWFNVRKTFLGQTAWYQPDSEQPGEFKDDSARFCYLFQPFSTIINFPAFLRKVRVVFIDSSNRTLDLHQFQFQYLLNNSDRPFDEAESTVGVVLSETAVLFEVNRWVDPSFKAQFVMRYALKELPCALDSVCALYYDFAP